MRTVGSENRKGGIEVVLTRWILELLLEFMKGYHGMEAYGKLTTKARQGKAGLLHLCLTLASEV